MTTLSSLRPVHVWVNPEHSVLSARILMVGHGMKHIAVVQGTSLVGVLSLEAAVVAPDDTPCLQVLRRNVIVLSKHTSIIDATERFLQADAEVAAVRDGDRFIGLVTTQMLLGQLKLSFDPQTGLGWSNQLREWCAETLTGGEEITVLFLDLNEFGKFNKDFGHVVGDNVLRQTSEMLSALVDPQREILVRYGGDEFAIGSKRPREESEELAQTLRTLSGHIQVTGATRPVHFSVGLAGGRRTSFRADMHVQSMVDELINAASRNCIENKGR